MADYKQGCIQGEGALASNSCDYTWETVQNTKLSRAYRKPKQVLRAIIINVPRCASNAFVALSRAAAGWQSRVFTILYGMQQLELPFLSCLQRSGELCSSPFLGISAHTKCLHGDFQIVLCVSSHSMADVHQ